MPVMANRRMVSIRRLYKGRACCCELARASMIGKMTSLLIMMLRAKVATMIMAVVADMPPKKINICRGKLSDAKANWIT